MARRPMPVPMNRRGAPGPRIPHPKPRRTGGNPLTMFAAVLLVLLLACGCIAVLASSGQDGARRYESEWVVIRTRPDYTHPNSTVGVAGSVRATISTSQPRDDGHVAIDTIHAERFSLAQGPELKYYGRIAGCN